jgi:hypothetical protein
MLGVKTPANIPRLAFAGLESDFTWDPVFSICFGHLSAGKKLDPIRLYTGNHLIFLIELVVYPNLVLFLFPMTLD